MANQMKKQERKEQVEQLKRNNLTCSCGGFVISDSILKGQILWRVKCIKCDRHTVWMENKEQARKAWDNGEIYIMGIKD